MGQFEDCLTMGDVMGKLYGKESQLVAGVLGLFYSICIASVQLLALGLVCQSLLGVPATWSMVLGGLVLTTYSATGGIKAVAMTDVFQFAVLVLAIPLVASIAVQRAGGVVAIFEQVPADKLAI